MKKNLFYSIIFVFILTTSYASAQDSEPWNEDIWDCQNIELPYTFCTPDGITTLCVKAPHNTIDNQGRKLKPIVRKIGNCTPNFDESSLASKDNITRNGKKIFDITKSKQDVLDAYNQWKNLYTQGCGLTEASGNDDCCPEVSFTDKVDRFYDKNDSRSPSQQAADTYAVTTSSDDEYIKSNYTEKQDAGGRNVCEAKCTSPVKIYLNKTPEFNNKIGNFYTQYFYTGKTAPNRNDLSSGNKTMSLYEIMMHEFGHYFGLNHTGDDADCKSMGSGKQNQMLMASPRAGGVARPREITQTNYNSSDQSPNPFQVIPNRDKCYFCKLYCPESSCASVDEVESESVRISPNPASTNLDLKFSSVIGNIPTGILITNVLGQNLELKSVEQTGGISYDISPLSAGVYFVSWKENGVNKSKKFVVNRR